MELRKYLRVVSNWWWLALTSFIIVTVAGFTFSFLQPPRYRTALTLVVSPKTTITDLSTVRQSLDTLDNLSIINTYAEIVRSRNIFELAIQKLSLPAASTGQVKVYVEVIQRTNMIKLTAEGNDPQIIYAVSNAIAGHAIEYVNSLYELYEIKILDAAVLPAEPFSPDIVRNTLLAAALGLIFGVGASFFAEYIRRPLEILESFSIIEHETGLYNRRYFVQRLREEISRARRHNRSLAVCMFNVKNLDQAESLYPENTRMTVRKRALSYVKRHIRQDEILANWDKSTYAWLLFDSAEASTRQAIERICNVLEAKVFEDDETGVVFSFTGTFGAAVYTKEMSETDLINQAIDALRKTHQYSLTSIYIANGEEAEDSAPEAKPRTARIG